MHRVIAVSIVVVAPPVLAASKNAERSEESTDTERPTSVLVN
jgi:hypothetical protein